MADDSFEAEVRRIGERLHRRAGLAPSSSFAAPGVPGRLLRGVLEDEDLRTALLRFLDVMPVLGSDRELARHFHEYLGSHAGRLEGMWGALSGLGRYPLAAPLVRHLFGAFARRFIVAEDAGELTSAITRVRGIPAGVSLDAVGEAALSEAECDAYRDRYLGLLDHLTRSGPLPGQPPIHLSVKLSALAAPFDPLDYAGVRRRVLSRLAPIVARLRERGGGLTVDMEQHEIKGLILRLFCDLIDAERGSGWLPGIALQAYLPETPEDLARLLAFAERRGQRIAVRLVKGAYWDSEVANARRQSWPIPVLPNKPATDAAFEALIQRLFERSDRVFPAIGSHNLRSLAVTLAAARHRGLSAQDYEIQMLAGMADPLCRAVAAEGASVRVYLPTGDLLPGVAYLIRRLLENTANTSILRRAFADGAGVDELLARPQPVGGATAERRGAVARARPQANTPLRDFGDEQVVTRFAAAIALVRGRLGRRYPLRIEGVPGGGAGWQPSVNPADPAEILGYTAVADVEHARRAIGNAVRAFPDWRDRSVASRSELCRRAAALMALRRDELAAWQVLEAGKNWREADADVAEAIDFLRYYALQMEDLAGWRPTICFPGEINQLRYEPRGVAAVITPWNFPLAILTGMTAAALVSGNVVILKPAAPANLIAQAFQQILADAGFPRGVCQLLPGEGATLGSFLVTHPEIDLVAFTGSRAVGLEILRLAHTPQPGQRHVKQVVCEMGGKNAVIVDADADLDEVVPEVLASAFDYQGQKCSACSRLIVVGRMHDRLVDRLAAALDAQVYGPPENPACRFGPLISAAARDKALGYLEIGRREGRLAYLGKVPARGFYCPPAIFTGIQPQHRLAREEIFGPVLAVLRADRFEEALRMALDSDYALTGGVFSRLPSHLALARDRFRVGNLYLNRRITGARVGVQPFGGVRLSGTGVQAGGPDYLRQFLWSRVVSENTRRHGFIPELDHDSAREG